MGVKFNLADVETMVEENFRPPGVRKELFKETFQVIHQDDPGEW